MRESVTYRDGMLRTKEIHKEKKKNIRKEKVQKMWVMRDYAAGLTDAYEVMGQDGTS